MADRGSSRGRLIGAAVLAILAGAGGLPSARAEAPPEKGVVEEAAPEASAGEARFDPVRIGIEEGELRAKFGDALLSVKIEARRPISEDIMAGVARRRAEPAPEGEKQPVAPAGPFADQLRFVRKVAEGDVRFVEYDLFRGKVYGIRWHLAERFERPLMNGLVARASDRLGEPLYDQLVKAKFGSGKADLRRAVWARKYRNLEVRQLNPLTGGPLFITVSDQAALRAIVASRGTAAPAPESSGSWWSRPKRETRVLTREERKTLLEAFGALLAQADF